MKARCKYASNPNYKYYGGKGIKVCDAWATDFWQFVADVGDKPTPTHTLDRIDTTKDYSADNCKWSSKREQCLNRKSWGNNTGEKYIHRTPKGMYQVGVYHDGKRIAVGLHSTLEDAVVARDDKLKELQNGRT